MPEETTHRSRRALLAAAAGGAAALAAQAALPLTAVAADPNDVVLGSANASTSTTSIANSTDASDGFSVTSVGLGIGVTGTSTGSAGVRGVSVDGSGAASADLTVYTGVYGWAPNDPETFFGTGVWGDSEDYGVYGSGSIGVLGYGLHGVWGEAVDPAYAAIVAKGATTTSPALKVVGKVSFNRSGRKQIGAGKSSVVVSLPGVTTSSKIFAVLATNRSGRYVRAVVPGTNQFTIYLNASYTSASYIAWMVLD